MKCFKCNNPHLDMVKVDDYLMTCPICSMTFDIEHAEHIEKELLEASYFHMSNEPLAEQSFYYLLSKDIKVHLIKDGIFQWLYIGEKGRNFVREYYKKQQRDTANKLDYIQGILSALEV